MYNKLKRITKINYYNEQIEINKHNMKKTWTILKKAIGKQSNKKNFPQSFQVGQKKISNPKEIADSFNNFFSKIGKTTSENVPKVPNNFEDYLKFPKLNSIFIEPVNKEQIKKVIDTLKPKMSFGHDDIPTKVVKIASEHILRPLTHIINQSLDSGVVPGQLKMAKVIPIFKAGDPEQLQNYRPVSLLPIFSKIYEKIMFKKIMSFLNSQNILYKHQYGFRPKHSTIHPIIHLLNNCAQANNNNPRKFTLSIFCDLSKAFDVINHNILIQKLEHYGIRGKAKTWIANYLANRSQYVKFENCKSESQKIECGVPQGSILGFFLYLLYVNDIINCTKANILSFADYTSLFVNNSNITELYEHANTEIKKTICMVLFKQALIK